MGTEILDVALGLSFIYFLMSVIISAIVEMLEEIVLRRRRRLLKVGIGRLLGDDQARIDAFYAHPLISSLKKTAGSGWLAKIVGRDRLEKVRPTSASYIPGQQFAVALLDILANPASAPVASAPVAPAQAASGRTDLGELTKLKAALEGNGSTIAKAALALVEQAGTDIEKAKANIVSWYDDSMDRISGEYKRWASWWTLGIAVIVVSVMNIDTIDIGWALWNDDELRSAIVEAAANAATQDVAASSTTDPAKPDSVAMYDATVARLDDLEGVGFPLGWSDWPSCSTEWLVNKVAGLLSTILAVSLGAPVWFELMNKIISLRSTGKVPQKEPAV